MKKQLLILVIILTSLIGYSQVIIEDQIVIHTTLLTINGVEKGHLWKGEPLLPAFEYVFLPVDTLKWTTINIDSLTVRNNGLQLQVDSLEAKLNDLIGHLKTQPILCD